MGSLESRARHSLQDLRGVQADVQVLVPQHRQGGCAEVERGYREHKDEGVGKSRWSSVWRMDMILTF